MSHARALDIDIFMRIATTFFHAFCVTSLLRNFICNNNNNCNNGRALVLKKTKKKHRSLFRAIYVITNYYRDLHVIT